MGNSEFNSTHGQAVAAHRVMAHRIGDQDKDRIVRLGIACEWAMTLQAGHLDDGQLLSAATAAEAAETYSDIAFAIAEGRA